MKKMICALTLCSVMSTSVFAGQQIEDSKFYYDDIAQTIEYTDDNGEKVSKGSYMWAEMLNGYIYAADENGMRGLLDQSLNAVIPFEYRNIEYNEYTDTYKCVKDDSDDYYDPDFNRVAQPVDIRPIENTQYYELLSEDEATAPLTSYYICDEQGNKLIDEPFIHLEGAEGSIIAVKRDNMSGIYNSALELAIPFEYTAISYENGVFSCWDYVSDKTEYISAKDFKTTEKVEEIYDSAYFYKRNNEGICYICGFNGETIKDKPYYEIKSIGQGKIAVRSSDSYPRLYGLLDENLNEITEEKYYRISDNEVGRIKCYGDKYTDIYDSRNNFVRKEENDLEFVKPIKGMDGKFIYNSAPDDNMPSENTCVIDDKGNKLSGNYLSIKAEAQLGNTLIAYHVVGHSDSSVGVLGPNMEPITSFEFGDMYVKEENGAIYIENEWAGSDTNYFDLYGNQYKTKAEAIAAGQTKGEASDWAKESIEKSIEAGIVPEEIQSQYIKKITRQEFCKLAVMTYMAKSDYVLEEGAENSFRDINDDYVTAAYNLKIVAGRGNNLFDPESSITRQEAAVMLNNLASLLNVNGTEKIDKFVDESYFADWAKDAIYSVAAMKSGDTYVMAGTGEGKFSPYDFYTREQAIATMWRTYNCETAPSEAETGDNTDTESIQSSYEEHHSDDHVRAVTSDPERLFSYEEYNTVLMDKECNILADYPYIEDAGFGVYFYKIHAPENDYDLLMGLLDRDGKVLVEAQYEDIITWVYNDTVTFKKGNTYYAYDTKGNLKGSIDYKLPDVHGEGAPYCVDSISGTNVIVRIFKDRYAMHGADPDMDWYIYRLFSKEKAADDYFGIRITDNGEFIANDLNDNKACVIDANGKLKLKTDFCTMYRVDKGLYFARSEFDRFQGLYKYFPEESAGDKVTFLDGDFQVIEEGLDNVEYEVDTENRVVKAYKNNEPFEFNY